MSKVNKTERDFDTVKFFKEVKTKIAQETEGMTFAELKAYIDKRKIKKDQSLPLA